MEIELIGISENINLIRQLIDQVVDTDLNIVVCGETGVGKEVVVRSLYEKSKRCGKPFVKVNCAALIIKDAIVENGWKDFPDPFAGVKLPKPLKTRVFPFSYREWKKLREFIPAWYKRALGKRSLRS